MVNHKTPLATETPLYLVIPSPGPILVFSYTESWADTEKMCVVKGTVSGCKEAGFPAIV